MIGGIDRETYEKRKIYNSSIRKVKGHIFCYLKQEKGIERPHEYKHRWIVKYFINLTGLPWREDLRFNYALFELLQSPEFKPYLKYKRPSSPAKRKRDYNSYISSPQWQKKREEAFALYGRVCVKCGTTNNLHVHHVTYENFMDEKMEDLMIVCKSCHDKIHNRKKSCKSRQ